MKKQPFYAVIQQSFLFADIPDCELQNIFFDVKVNQKDFNAGQSIFFAGWPFGMLLSGKASVIKDRNGTPVFFRLLKAGDIFGVSNLFAKENSENFEKVPTSIYAKTKCRVVFFTVRDIEKIILQNKTITRNYIEFLTDRICFLNQKIDAFTAGTAEKKVIKFLLSLECDPNERINLPMSLLKTAEMLDISRATLYRILEQLCQNGLIRRDKKCICILNRKALEALS